MMCHPSHPALSAYEVADNGCWIWTGAFTHLGPRGQPAAGGRAKLNPRRILFEIHRGRPPAFPKLISLCEDSRCVHPMHWTDDMAEILAWRSRRVGDCIEYTGSRNEPGYGVVGFRSKNHLAHRAAWILVHGPIPDGYELDHECVNPPCMNVDHLALVTHQENCALAHSRRREAGIFNRKAECIHGHPLSGDNLYVDRHGGRQCRACRRVNVDRSNAKAKAARAAARATRSA